MSGGWQVLLLLLLLLRGYEPCLRPRLSVSCFLVVAFSLLPVYCLCCLLAIHPRPRPRPGLRGVYDSRRLLGPYVLRCVPLVVFVFAS